MGIFLLIVFAVSYVTYLVLRGEDDDSNNPE